jgi:hypothetical protein
MKKILLLFVFVSSLATAQDASIKTPVPVSTMFSFKSPFSYENVKLGETFSYQFELHNPSATPVAFSLSESPPACVKLTKDGILTCIPTNQQVVYKIIDLNKEYTFKVTASNTSNPSETVSQNVTIKIVNGDIEKPKVQFPVGTLVINEGQMLIFNIACLSNVSPVTLFNSNPPTNPAPSKTVTTCNANEFNWTPSYSFVTTQEESKTITLRFTATNDLHEAVQGEVEVKVLDAVNCDALIKNQATLVADIEKFNRRIQSTFLKEFQKLEKERITRRRLNVAAGILGLTGGTFGLLSSDQQKVAGVALTFAASGITLFKGQFQQEETNPANAALLVKSYKSLEQALIDNRFTACDANDAVSKYEKLKEVQSKENAALKDIILVQLGDTTTNSNFKKNLDRFDRRWK